MNKTILKICVVLASGLYLSAPLAVRAAPPLFLGKGEPNFTGLAEVERITNLSSKVVREFVSSSKTEKGLEIEFLTMLPYRNGADRLPVSAVVFVAPFQNERFRTVHQSFAKALVARLGCAVVSFAVPSGARTANWHPENYYAIERAGYFQSISNVIGETKKRFGTEETPVFCVGYCSGAVMALYLSNYLGLKCDGVVGFELAQPEEFTPHLFDLKVPSLVINPDDGEFNDSISTRIFDAKAKGAPVEMLITRPKVDKSPPEDRVNAFYYRRIGGMYSDALAYCFLKDAIAMKKAEKWPEGWNRRITEVSCFGQTFRFNHYGTTADFDALVKLGSFNAIDESEPGMRTAAFGGGGTYRKIVFFSKRNFSFKEESAMMAICHEYGVGGVIGTFESSDQLEKRVENLLFLAVKHSRELCLVMLEGDDPEWNRIGELLVSKYKGVTISLSDHYVPWGQETSPSVAKLRKVSHDGDHELLDEAAGYPMDVFDFRRFLLTMLEKGFQNVDKFDRER